MWGRKKEDELYNISKREMKETNKKEKEITVEEEDTVEKKSKISIFGIF